MNATRLTRSFSSLPRILLLLALAPGAPHARKRGQTPGNLGLAVNTSDTEYKPELSPDRQQFIFGRDGRMHTLPVDAIPALRRPLRGKHPRV